MYPPAIRSILYLFYPIFSQLVAYTNVFRVMSRI